MHEIELTHDGCCYAVMVIPRGAGVRVHVYRRFGTWVGDAEHDGERFTALSPALRAFADALAERLAPLESTAA